MERALIAVGLASIVAAWTYTGGPRPYGYAGLGEVFVFVFFGLLATAGSFCVTTEDVSLLAVVSGAVSGFLSVALLVVNNIRDIENDRLSGKMALAVDAAHPSDNYESVNVGGEYVFDDFIYVRGGMKSLFQKDSEESFTAGLGVRQFVVGNLQISVDYSYQDLKRLKSSQKVTLGVAF